MHSTAERVAGGRLQTPPPSVLLLLDSRMFGPSTRELSTVTDRAEISLHHYSGVDQACFIDCIDLRSAILLPPLTWRPSLAARSCLHPQGYTLVALNMGPSIGQKGQLLPESLPQSPLRTAATAPCAQMGVGLLDHQESRSFLCCPNPQEAARRAAAGKYGWQSQPHDTPMQFQVIRRNFK